MCLAPEPPDEAGSCALDRPETEALGAPALAFASAASESNDVVVARAAIHEARSLLRAGKRGDAVLQLRVVERSLPRVADRFALERGDLLRELGMPEQACEAYALAVQSPDRNVAARAQIGAVRCLLQAGDHKAERAYEALAARYSKLPLRQELDYDLALAREGWGHLRAAAELLRRIDLQEPAGAVAERARAELARLAGQGVKVAPLTASERVGRAERLLFDGPIEQAAAEIAAIGEERGLNAELRAKLQELGARVARVQGRWERSAADAKPAKATAVFVASGEDDASAAESDRVAAQRRVRALRGSKPIARLNAGPLFAVLDIAVEHGLQEECDQALDTMRTRRSIDPAARFNAAIRASGVASDASIAALLETVIDVPRYRVSARYHYARALERLGRGGEAEAQYLRLLSGDRGASSYYAMWADLRLWAMQSQSRESCLSEQARDRALLSTETAGDEEPAAAADDLASSETPAPIDEATVPPAPPSMSLVGAIFDTPSLPSAPAARALPVYERAEEGLAASESSPEPDDGAQPTAPADTATQASARAAAVRARVLELLAPIAARHGEAYPWLLRALDLAQIDQQEAAADEINEAYLAYRDATGALRLRSGLFALLTGSAPPRRAVTYAVATARRALDRKTRATLSDVANLLGDPGVGVRFGSERFDARPRAYAALVERAAAAHGLDPNLLFAVMRVESIYNRRIISNAGAVGLMQIMPATGERIAKQLGVVDFDPTDLLDPERNLEFSAWYLASLLRRFDGRLPLAIASYNGGPHNVRLWMRRNPAHM
ncbi:MAG: transglycosylase SLT domain-containing protein, partial [Polyangiales bacterium]